MTRHLKVVDEFGNVRIEAEVRNGSDEVGPWFTLYGRDGAPAASLSVVEEAGGRDLIHLWMATGDDCEASVCVGGMKGAGINLSGPTRTRRDWRRGTRLELLANNDAAFVVAHGEGEARTMMQLIPGEQPATFVDEAADESEATS